MTNIIRTEIEKNEVKWYSQNLYLYVMYYVLCTTLWGFLNEFIINSNKCVNIDSV